MARRRSSKKVSCRIAKNRYNRQFKEFIKVKEKKDKAETLYMRQCFGRNKKHFRGIGKHN